MQSILIIYSPSQKIHTHGISSPYLELGPNLKVVARTGSNDPGKVNNVPYSPKGPCPSENASPALFFSFPVDAEAPGPNTGTGVPLPPRRGKVGMGVVRQYVRLFFCILYLFYVIY